MTQQLTTWSLLTATAGILAFLIGVYTLVGRDRKSPYLINSVFTVFLICLVGATLDIAAQIVAPSPLSASATKIEANATEVISSHRETAAQWMLVAGAVALLTAVVVTIQRMWTIYVRFAYFVDPGRRGRLRLLPGVRQFRAWWKRTPGPKYEYNPVPLSRELQKRIDEIIIGAAGVPVENAQTDMFPEQRSQARAEVRDHQDPRSLAMALRHQGQANDVLSQLCIAFLRQNDHYVQYITASRHPIEFIQHLKGVVVAQSLTWTVLRNRIVAVDAYTPHFGFLDTINDERSKVVRDDLGDRLLSSSETYAGLHSASSAAFKRIKRAGADATMRQPTLVIYEDTYALSDLESVEQYRIFARHVIPSERLWDGMFTVFAETAQREEDWKLISSYAGMTLDLRAQTGGRRPEREKRA